MPKEEDIEQQVKQRFGFKKIGSFYYIIDNDTGNKCVANGKVLRSKGVKRLGETLYMLREGYKKQLMMEDS